MENNEFEKVETKKKKNRGIVKSHKKNKLAKVATVLLIASLISIFAGCTSSCNPDPSIDDPGIVEPLPDEPDDPVIDPDDPVIDPDDPVIDPDDPVIDPDDPVIDPDDPVIDPDPSDPTDPDDPENPGDPEIPGDEAPEYEDCKTVDDILASNGNISSFIQDLKNNYLDNLSKYLIGRNGTADSFDSVEWYVANNSNNEINGLYANVYYTQGNSKYFKVGKVSFDAVDTVQDIINGNLNNVTYSVDYQNPQSSFANIENNTDLGKTVIQTIDADNTLEGDIWCSIGGLMASGGRDYRIITVYQITENGVEKYELTAEAPSADPTSIIANIQEKKYTTTSQSTEYTFAGEKIEQANESSQNLANYNYYFDDDIALC